MSKVWRTVKLEAVLSQDRNYVHDLASREYFKLSVKLYGKGCVVSGSVNGHEVKMQRHQLARSGQVILSEIWGKKGAIGVVPQAGEGALVTSHFFLFDLVSNEIEREWLTWLISANYFEHELSQEARGSTGYAAVRPKQFLGLTIPLPPLDEQRRIVTKLDALRVRVEQAVALQGAAIEESQHWFMSAQRRYFEGLAAKHGVRPLKGLFAFRQELQRHKSGGRGEARFVGLQHIGPNTGRRIGEDIIRIEELSGRKFRFSAGNIVYGYLRPYLNKVWVADCEGLCSVDQYVLQPDNSQVLTAYLAYAMRSPLFLRQSEELTGILTLPRLRSGLLEQIQIPVPPLAVQEKAIKHLDTFYAAFDELTLLQRDSLEEIEAFMPSVLDRAFRGEL